MPKFSFEEVKQKVEENGWTLLSTSYVNLNTDLEVLCPEGHKIFKPFKFLRENTQCPLCKKQSLQQLSSVSIPKNKNFRILALDQATLITGWSLWDGKELIAHGIFSAQETKDTIKRIREISNWVVNMVENNKPDLVILEDIQLQEFKNPKNTYAKFDNVGIITFKTLAKLMGVLEATLEDRKINYKVVFSSTWRSAVGVKGKSRADKKKSAQLLVKKEFGINASEDEADAICIGKYGAITFSKEVDMISWN